MRHDPISPTIAAGVRLAPTVRWEPCAEHDDDPSDPGVCAGCGWPGDDHDRAPRGAAVRPRPSPRESLRRAS